MENSSDKVTNCHHVLLIDYIKKYHANLDELNNIISQLNNHFGKSYGRSLEIRTDLSKLLNKLNEQKQAIEYLSL